MTVKVKHPNGYFGILYGRNSMAVYDELGHQVVHTGSRSINTEQELYAVLEKMPEFKDLLLEEEKNE